LKFIKVVYRRVTREREKEVKGKRKQRRVKKGEGGTGREKQGEVCKSISKGKRKGRGVFNLGGRGVEGQGRDGIVVVRVRV
jgi:hypothetical protein